MGAVWTLLTVRLLSTLRSVPGGNNPTISLLPDLQLWARPLFRQVVTRLGQRTLVHCNMYRHLPVRQIEDVHYRSSLARHDRLDCRADKIRTEEEVRFWLGDQQGDLPVFRTEEKLDDVLVTLATGSLLLIALLFFQKRWGEFSGRVWPLLGCLVGDFEFYHLRFRSFGEFLEEYTPFSIPLLSPKSNYIYKSFISGIFHIENKEMKLYTGNPREENLAYRRELICWDSLEQHLCKTYENCWGK